MKEAVYDPNPADNSIYYLRLIGRQQIDELSEQLRKPGASPLCRELGEKLLYYFRPKGGGCAICGGPSPEFSYPLSPLVEVYVEGLKGVGERSLSSCRRCINDYYIRRGEAPAFPELVEAP